MLGNFTIIDLGVDSWLIIFNILVYLIIALGVAIVVYLSRKMGERIRNSIYFILLSVLFVGFFKTTVIEYLTSLFWEISFILSQCYEYAVRTICMQALALLAFVVFVTFPKVFEVANSFLRKKHIKHIEQNVTSSYQNDYILSKGCNLKPLFHILS